MIGKIFLSIALVLGGMALEGLAIVHHRHQMAGSVTSVIGVLACGHQVVGALVIHPDGTITPQVGITADQIDALMKGLDDKHTGVLTVCLPPAGSGDSSPDILPSPSEVPQAT